LPLILLGIFLDGMPKRPSLKNVSGRAELFSNPQIEQKFPWIVASQWECSDSGGQMSTRVGTPIILRCAASAVARHSRACPFCVIAEARSGAPGDSHADQA
jgi:hypothetical protein